MRSNMNFLFALLVVVLISTLALASRSCGPARIPGFIEPMVTLEEAEARSGQSGKPVFALVGADWCEHCTALKRGALSNSKVVTMLKEQTEPVYIDVSRWDKQDADAIAMMTRLGVKGLPAMILIKRGQQIGHVEGEIAAKDLLPWLEETVKANSK